MNGILPMLIMLPLLGGCLLLTFGTKAELIPARRTSLAIAGMTLLLGLVLAVGLWGDAAAPPTGADPATTAGTAETIGRTSIQPLLEFKPDWMVVRSPGGIQLPLSLGVDSLGLTMVLLTNIVVLVVLLSATLSVCRTYIAYAGWILLAQAGLLTVFLAMDLILFYVGFELALLPLLVLVSKWGSEGSAEAGKRFVLFTLAGSIPMVLALIGLMQKYSPETGPTVLLEDLSRQVLIALPSETPGSQFWIFALLVLGLGIKMAILPLHTWLPSTYMAAHPTTSALLAGVVLKLGLFGFLRLVLPLTPLACHEWGPMFLGSLGVIAIVYGALAALGQSDLRKLLAYASLSHVGFITLGMFSLSSAGIAGASLQMFNHGITTAALFLLANSLIARRGTASLEQGSRGLATLYPRLGALMVFFVMAGAGLPGLNNFVGELLALTSMMQRIPTLALFGTLGVILGAWYSLRLVCNLMFGEHQFGSENRVARIRDEGSLLHPKLGGDLLVREWLPMLALGVLCLWIGCLPQQSLGWLRPDAERLGAVFQDLDKNANP